MVVPPWGRALLVLRTALAPVFDRLGKSAAAEVDALFQADVDERGTEAASKPVGPGGEAGASREGSSSATAAEPVA